MALPKSLWGRIAVGCMAILMLFAAFIGVIVWQMGRPFYGPVSVSPDREWRVWLQRPHGSMEPKFYSVMVARRRWFGNGPSCEIGGLTNWQAENYTRFRWVDARTVRLDYGIADRDTARAGAPWADRSCPPARLILRHDRALDGAASTANDMNMDYAVPVREDPAIAAMSEEMERSNAQTH
ncbi:hypothetical protein [uncultured Sphingomonas sp.]|uniref:hypothetical protein n=1 Tax=uncultured Sphingomonas sp. TaxID=158754 RepID=UPI00258A2C69|nr:hypothetical protein [uncultured Sphingomonas sp.]